MNNNLKVSFKGKSGQENWIEARVTNEHNTTRVWRHELESGSSALAKQMNAKVFSHMEEAIETIKLEFENGSWDDPRFYNQVV